MWLDELQRYLDGEHGLTGGVVRALLGAPGPVVIIGTLWPDRYTAYTAVPAPGGADPHAREREVLDLAAVVRIGAQFSPAEQGRARAAAARDRRLRVALGAAGYGLTQTLAAAPQLVARWQDAQAANPYAWAVLTAALDAARLGARAPLPAGLLRAAAPGYCTSAQQAEAPDNWFEQALAYATEKLHGAAAALAPAGTGMGQIAGYTVADYLIQHASRERRTARVPASTWDALLSHIRDPADAARLADSAEGRLLYCYAIPLYRHAADAGDENAAGSWPICWPGAATWTGHPDAARPGRRRRPRTPPRSWPFCWPRRGDLDELRARADAGDAWPPCGWPSCWPSAGTWPSCAPAPTPATCPPPWSWPSCWPSAGTWTSCAPAPTPATGWPPGSWPSCWPGAGTWTSCAPAPTPATGSRPATGRAAGRAPGTWTSCAPAPTPATGMAALQLAGLLAGAGPGRAARPRRRRRQVRRPAAGRAAGRARGPGRAARPRRRRRQVRRPAAGRAAGRGAGTWTSCAPAPTPATGPPPGSWPSCWPSAGDLDELRTRADAGDLEAALQLAELLAKRGDLDELRSPADAGDRSAALQLAELLAKRGDLDELRTRADAGDRSAALQLAELLAGAGDLDELRTRADAGDGSAASRLAELLAERGDLDELRTRADADLGDVSAASQLAGLLAERGDLDEAMQILCALAAAGRGNSNRLAGLLTQQGHRDEAERLRRFGLNPDGSIASD